MTKLLGVDNDGNLGNGAVAAITQAGFTKSGHKHEIPDVTGLPEVLANKAPAAAALPAGGAPGQVLTKSASTDYVTYWADVEVSSGGGTPAAVRSVTQSFTPSNSHVPNPEQGWFIYSETTWGANGAGWRPLVLSELLSRRTGTEVVGGYTVPARTLLFRYVIMNDFINKDTLSTAFLDALKADFATAREAGVKLIIRFCYSNDGNTGSNAHTDGPYGTDTTPARTMGHVAQLKSTVQANKDIIHAVEAGLVGTWGEWYYTDNWGNKGDLTTQQWADRANLISALLDWGVDYVLLRYVGLKRRYLRGGSGWTVHPDGAAKLGFHNDAFQASDNIEDWGTFSTFVDGMTVTEARAYLATETARPVPMVGETAGTSSRSNYTATAQSLAEQHWSALNPNYHDAVLASWATEQKDEVARKLGARLSLDSATLPSSGGAGAMAMVTLKITNSGWGSPLQDRPLQVVFKDGSNLVRRTLSRSVRSLAPGQHTILEEVQLPSTPGAYTLHLALPDRASSLASRPEYAYQLATSGISWGDGMNGLGVTTTVASAGSAGGTVSVVETPAGSGLYEIKVV